MKYDFKIDRLYFIENEMQRCEMVYMNRIINITLFEGWSLGFILISKAVKEDQILFKAYTKKEHRKKIIDSLDEIKAFNSIDSYRRDIFEKSYIDLYQAFESFILDCYISIFYTFPKFIRLYDDKIDSSIDFSDKTFIRKNETLVNDLIDLTVDKISRNHLIDQISSLNKLPVNIKLPIRDLKRIIKLSNTRNQLVHNDGKISNNFIKKLDKQGINHNYKIGNYLTRVSGKLQCTKNGK